MAKDPTQGPLTKYHPDGSQSIEGVEDEKDVNITVPEAPTITTAKGDLTIEPYDVAPLDWVDAPTGADMPKLKPKPKVVVSSFRAMPVIILAGGKGTRLAEETQGLIPKPLVNIGGAPMLEHVINIYAQQGVKEFYIATGFMAKAVHQWWSDRRDHYADRGLKVAPVTTGIDTGTGGRLLRMTQEIGDRNFMMTYGDGFADIDLRKLEEHFQEKGQPVALTAAHPPTRFGNLEIDDGIATKFGEKTQTSVDWINAGFYMMKPEVFKLMPRTRIEAEACSLEFDVLPKLASEKKLAAYQHHGFFQMCDTPRDLRKLQLMWEKGDVPWLNWMKL